jgi:DNA-binding Xre family transcriptional regulator
MVRGTRTIKSDASRKIEENMNKVWNHRLSEMRIKRGISKSELAAGADVTPATITGWENGSIKTIKSENLLKACLYLNVSPY